MDKQQKPQPPKFAFVLLTVRPPLSRPFPDSAGSSREPFPYHEWVVAPLSHQESRCRWAWEIINVHSLTPLTPAVQVSGRTYDSLTEAKAEALAALEVWQGFIPKEMGLKQADQAPPLLRVTR